MPRTGWRTVASHGQLESEVLADGLIRGSARSRTAPGIAPGAVLLLSGAMIRALVESLAVTDVQDRLAEVAVPALVVHRGSDFV